MNKYRGSSFDDYLKERGMSEEVSTLARKRWETLRTEDTPETENSTEVSDDQPKRTNTFLRRLRHRISHLFSLFS
ncbi:MAG: hypothetical protein OXN27_17225 [Candidatus Poribacteria bacterium]|nr:hypothetical protein [Candidatus Poribacteria bacterium]MDE0325659.1 hypothetical protein [Candidatus Poribacteria bacterium]